MILPNIRAAWIGSLLVGFLCLMLTTAWARPTSFTTCPNPSVGGTVSYAGGALCASSNAGTLQLSGHTGNVIKWQTSTNGGGAWTDVASSTATYLNFVNAANGQQYRAVVNNRDAGPASSCTDANSTAVTLVTSSTACASPACDNAAGAIVVSVASTTALGIEQRILATNASGIIQYIGNPGSSTLTGVAGGQYLVYVVSYDPSILPAPALGLGVSLSSVGGKCIQYSNQLAYRVCVTIGLPTVSIVSPASNGTASTSPTVSGTATPGSVIAITDPNGATLCSSTATAGGLWSCSVALSPGSTTLTATACTSVGCGTTTTSFTAGPGSGTTSCANPPVGGLVSYAGGVLCNSSNAGTLQLSGQTGNIVKWQTSTNGGGAWTDVASNTATYLNFVNATNGQQYRAVVSNGGSCADANSTAVTLVTSSTACASPACDNAAGAIVVSVASTTAVGIEQRIIATNANGIIQYIGNPGSGTISNVAGGQYLVYVVSYDPSIMPAPALGLGASLSSVGGKCIQYSNQLAYRVCVIIGLPTVSIVSPAQNGTATTSPTVSGTATPNSLVTLTDPNGATLCSTTATAGGLWSCSIALSPGSTTLTATACTSVGCGTMTTSFTAGPGSGTTSCANPPVGGLVSYAGGVLCNSSNAGTLQLSGQTGNIVKWQTSTNGGGAWTDVASNTATYLNFVNATNGQQYRALIGTGGSCADAPSTAVTLVTSNTACASPTCDNSNGAIVVSVASTTAVGIEQRIIATNANGLIQYIGNPGSGTISNVSGGQYLVYVVSYDPSIMPAPALGLGASLSGVGGKCIQYSNQLAYRVCVIIGLPTVSIVSPAQNGTATTSPTVSGTATPNSLVTLTDPNGATLCSTTATAGGLWSCPVTLSPGSTTLTATACTSVGCGTTTTSFTAVVLPASLSLNPSAPLASTAPVVSGTATPGSRVEITGPNGATLCTTTADPISGTFSCPVSLPPGSQTVTVNVCTSANCTSALTSLSVLAPCTNPSIGGTASYTGAMPLCSTANTGTITLSGHTGTVIRWEMSTNSGSTWSPVANTTTSLIFNNITTTRYYRAVVNTGGSCADATSSVVTLTTSPAGCVTVDNCDYPAGIIQK